MAKFEITFPAGTRTRASNRYLGENVQVNNCCSEWFPCDVRDYECADEVLAAPCTIEIEISDEALRSVAFRALAAKGKRGTAGGMVSRVVGIRVTERRISRVIKHESKRKKAEAGR